MTDKLVAAEDRRDVVLLDIGEQSRTTAFVLMYNESGIALDDFRVTGGVFQGFVAGRLVVSFNARRAPWLLLDRSLVKLASKAEITAAMAALQKLQEDEYAKHHPDEHAAMSEQRRQFLSKFMKGGHGHGVMREPGQYL